MELIFLYEDVISEEAAAGIGGRHYTELRGASITYPLHSACTQPVPATTDDYPPLAAKERSATVCPF